MKTMAMKKTRNPKKRKKTPLIPTFFTCRGSWGPLLAEMGSSLARS